MVADDLIRVQIVWYGVLLGKIDKMGVCRVIVGVIGEVDVGGCKRRVCVGACVDRFEKRFFTVVFCVPRYYEVVRAVLRVVCVRVV